MHDQKTHALEVGRLFRRPDSTDDFTEEHVSGQWLVVSSFSAATDNGQLTTDALELRKNLRRVANVARRRRNDRLIAYVNLLTLLNRPTNVVFADEICGLVSVA